MAKMMKSRRLRKRVRKTLGALFLASAIAVAAIPVDDLQASTGAGGALGVTLTPYGSGKDTDSTIPKIDKDERVYATGDGVYQFAYVNPNPNQAGGNKVAVLVGYSSSGHTLDGGNLSIPDTVNVYAKYTDNQGSSEGYVAVGRNLHFLFWRRTIHETDPVTGELLYNTKEVDVIYYPLLDGTKVSKEEYEANPSAYARKPLQDTDADGKPKVDENGNPVYVKDPQGNIVYEADQPVKETVKDPDSPITHYEFEPCYYRTKDIEGGWGTLADPNDPRYDEFYALNMGPDGEINVDYNRRDDEGKIFHQTLNSEEQWIVNVSVEYIGNQTVNSNGEIGDWITAEAVEAGNAQGVFSGNGNIVNLKVGPNLKGIGDYAFYRCTGLQSITLSNNLETIGNHAFDSCLNIKDITVDANCNMRRIGDHAFYNCQSLKSFVMPTPVEAIGDGAFENCYALNSIEMYSP
ncbi:MAG: leucine-rich repeat domain-containing protein, partial [Acetatifactor sp.]|nr:leucine-rich repeat domain-containing protein [Acetatifactor sp.]